jgi:hypothetical protein
MVLKNNGTIWEITSIASTFKIIRMDGTSHSGNGNGYAPYDHKYESGPAHFHQNHYSLYNVPIKCFSRGDEFSYRKSFLSSLINITVINNIEAY